MFGLITNIASLDSCLANVNRKAFSHLVDSLLGRIKA